MRRDKSLDENGGSGSKMGKRVAQVSCDECFFRQRGLCAVRGGEPCATFRPDTPEGLAPPTQMRFVFRQERRTRAAWAMPSAQERAAMYAA
jgi:hypothetical protein